MSKETKAMRGWGKDTASKRKQQAGRKKRREAKVNMLISRKDKEASVTRVKWG